MLSHKSRGFFRLLLVILTVGLASAGTLAWLGCGTAANHNSPKAVYLLLYAFPAEGKLLAAEMEISAVDTVLERPVQRGALRGKDIILAESGMGMTNAAMTVQRLIDEYHPDAVVFSGIAGAIDSSVKIGDIVVNDRWATHDYGYIGGAGFEVEPVYVFSPEADSMIERFYFETDSELLAIARELKSNLPEFDSIGGRVPRLIVGGTGVSGDQFIDQVEKRVWLSEEFGALTTDMESAAVAQVCFANDVPFLVFRSASDLAGGSGSESAVTEIREFFQVAADNSAEIVMLFFELM